MTSAAHLLVVGVIGVMQALETIKIIVDTPDLSSVKPKGTPYQPSMTLFAAFDAPQWRTFRLRPKRETCISCGKDPSITAQSIAEGQYDQICKRTIPNEITKRVSVKVDYLCSTSDFRSITTLEISNMCS